MMDILLTCYSFTAFVTALTASVAANHGIYLFSNCLPSRQRLLTKSSLCVSMKSRNFVCCVSGIWVHLVQFVWTKLDFVQFEHRMLEGHEIQHETQQGLFQCRGVAMTLKNPQKNPQR